MERTFGGGGVFFLNTTRENLIPPPHPQLCESALTRETASHIPCPYALPLFLLCLTGQLVPVLRWTSIRSGFTKQLESPGSQLHVSNKGDPSVLYWTNNHTDL